MATANPTSKNPLDLFVEGAKQGWNVAINSMLPNVVMAFVLIHILNISGILKLIGTVAGPMMALWGLPGEAIVVLLAALMSMGGAVGVSAGLIGAGTITGTHAVILSPAIMLMGSMVQYLGRCLGTADANRKYWGWHILICVINGLIGLWIMQLLVKLFF